MVGVTILRFGWALRRSERMHVIFGCVHANARAACLLHIAYVSDLLHAGRYDSVNKIRSQRTFSYCGIVAKIRCEQGRSRAGKEQAPLLALICGELRIKIYKYTTICVGRSHSSSMCS